MLAYYHQMRLVEPDAEVLHRARAAYYGLVETLMTTWPAAIRSQSSFGDNVVLVQLRPAATWLAATALLETSVL